jgi:hypothetical protein
MALNEVACQGEDWIKLAQDWDFVKDLIKAGNVLTD